METKEVTLTVEQVPRSFNRCFQSDCPQAAECIRYLVREYVPEYVTNGFAVFPTARREGTCRWFKQTRVVQMAWGFSRLFDEVKAKDSSTMHKQLYAYLGSRMEYSRYHRGLKKLTPEQRQGIARLFRSHGYEAEPVYDNYAYEYDFTD